MKKIVLFLFLIFSMAIVNARTCLERDAALSATQVFVHEDLQASIMQMSHLDFAFNDASLLFESSKMVVLRPYVGSAITANFQIMKNKFDILKAGSPRYRPRYRMIYVGVLTNEAISPKCRTVLLENLSQTDLTRNFAVKTQAVSPNCRDVIKTI